MGFNPRPRVGGDSYRLLSAQPWLLFQSTPPRGGRHEGTTRYGCDKCFNPRPRVGGDEFYAKAIRTVKSVSIHAPAWGATALDVPRHAVRDVSIHAPAWGATPDKRDARL